MSTAPSPSAPARSPLAALLALALPMVLARATQAVDTFADAYQIRDLGPGAITAVSSGGLNVFAVLILMMGTVFIVQSFVAQLRGKGDLDATPRFAWYGLSIALVAGLLGLAMLPVIGPALGLTAYAPAVRVDMTAYMEVRLLSVGAVVGIEVLGNWYGGLGNTWMQMLTGVIMMITNIVFNWLLIDGHLGFPALGVEGAAWSSVIAAWLGFALMAVAFWWRLGGAPKARATGLSWRELRRVVRFGLPNGINWFFEFAAFQLFVVAIMPSLGTEAVAALSVVIAINSISFMPAFGLASAGAILAGEAIGRGAHDEVWPQVKRTLACAGAWMGVIGLSYLVAPRTLLELFASDEVPVGQLVELGTTMLIMSAGWQLFDAVTLTLAETLRAAGDTTWTMWARVILAWAVFMPTAYLVVHVGGGGAASAMLCLAGYVALLAGLLTLRFRSGAWRRIELVEPTLV